MQSSPQEVITYPQHLQPSVQKYRKRLSIEQFQAIDAKRIKQQFNLLDYGQINNYEKNIHHGQKHKDRYSDIKAYCHSRVVLEKVPGFYINASYMKSVLDDSVWSIFAQAPLKKAQEHFWQACFHHKVRKIIMLCAFEDPKRGTQAEKYWPEPGKTINFDNPKLSLTCGQVEQLDDEFQRTQLILQSSEGTLVLEHNHWTGWSDMRKPFGPKAQGLFRSLVEDTLRMVSEKQMVMIHCSAGIGRTGTLGTMIEALRCARMFKALSVFEIVDNMRRHRMACVQTLEQYGFIYQELKKML